jgi:hypothetical protein
VLDARGAIIQEVPIATRRLDGLYLPHRSPAEIRMWSSDDDLADLLCGHSEVEVVEVKRRLNSDVIGQAVAGSDILRYENPRVQRVGRTVVVEEGSSPALEWVCQELNITVYRAPV